MLLFPIHQPDQKTSFKALGAIIIGLILGFLLFAVIVTIVSEELSRLILSILIGTTGGLIVLIGKNIFESNKHKNEIFSMPKRHQKVILKKRGSLIIGLIVGLSLFSVVWLFVPEDLAYQILAMISLTAPLAIAFPFAEKVRPKK